MAEVYGSFSIFSITSLSFNVDLFLLVKDSGCRWDSPFLCLFIVFRSLFQLSINKL